MKHFLYRTGHQHPSPLWQLGVLLGVLLLHGGVMAWLVYSESATNPLTAALPSPPALMVEMVEMVESQKSTPITPPNKTVQPIPVVAPVLATQGESVSSVALVTDIPKPVIPKPISAPPAAAPAVATVPSVPRFDADYLNNPAPTYPPLSRRLREEGKVVLRVFVDSSGAAGTVEMRTSSGFERLDKSALAAVSRWKFVPAKQGNEAVGAWVLVPIVFSLKD